MKSVFKGFLFINHVLFFVVNHEVWKTVTVYFFKFHHNKNNFWIINRNTLIFINSYVFTIKFLRQIKSLKHSSPNAMWLHKNIGPICVMPWANINTVDKSLRLRPSNATYIITLTNVIFSAPLVTLKLERRKNLQNFPFPFF